MAFPYDIYPWIDFHSLNLAYFIHHFREIFAQWDALYNGMLEWKDATEEELDTWKNGVMDAIDNWEHDFSAEIQVWQQETETDLANWKSATLAALDAWKTAAEATFEAIRVQAAGSASAAAQSAAAADTARAAAVAAQTAAEDAAASLTSALSDLAALKTDALQYMPASEVNALTIITDMPTSRYFTANGTKIRNIADYRYNANLPENVLLPSSFEQSGQYLVKSWRYAAGHAIYEIYRLNGSLHYWAYYGSTNLTAWIDYSPAATASAISAIAQDIEDLRTVDASALHQYDGTIPADPLISLPVNTYLTLTGAQLKSEYPSDPFIAELGDTYTYIVTIYPLLSSYRRIQISSRSQFPMLDGNTAVSHPNSVTWNWKIPMTSAEKSYLTEQLRPAVQIYTDLTFSAGWYNANGEIVNIDANHVHIDPIPVSPSAYYYFSATFTIPDGYTPGVFLDDNKQPITPVSFTPSSYSYDKANADPQSSLTSYVPIYRVRTPSNARYLSYNVDKAADTLYRLYFASIPVYRHYNTGNLILHSDDSALQYWGKRRLAVIGASTVMIDRLLRSGNFENDGSTQSQYVVGFQEYLQPYWQSLKSFGFSGASWAEHQNESDSDTGTHSMYYWLVTKQLYDSELAGYDDYLLLSSSNIPVTPGTLTSYDDLGDSHTYIGAMRRVIQHIYDLNPQARIYIQDWRHYTALYSDTSGVWASATAILEALNKLSFYLSIPLIPMFKDSGINHVTSPKWTYDNNDPAEVSGSGHWNHIGSRVVGEFFKTHIIG